MSKNYYDTLGITKSATADEIKKAYRKKAMEWHPDKHKGDEKAEKKFKEINEAYQVLSDAQKKQQYDTFGTADFSWMGWGGAGAQGFGGFDFGDIFGGGFSGGQQRGGAQSFEFDLGDLFGSFSGGGASRGHTRRQTVYEEPESLDISKTVELPIWDFLLGTKLSIESGGKSFKVAVPAGTKPGTKLKVSGKGKKDGRRTGDLYLKVDARMPKNLTDEQKKIIEGWR